MHPFRPNEDYTIPRGRNGLAAVDPTVAAGKRIDQNPEDGETVSQFLSENG